MTTESHHGSKRAPWTMPHMREDARAIATRLCTHTHTQTPVSLPIRAPKQGEVNKDIEVTPACQDLHTLSRVGRSSTRAWAATLNSATFASVAAWLV